MTKNIPLLIGIAFDTDMTHLNGVGALISLLFVAIYYYDRIHILDQCLKPNAKIDDIRRAKKFLLLIALWAAISFLVCGAILKFNYIISLIIFIIGWLLLTFLGHDILKKVEDPNKKRSNFFNLLPKEPPKN